jgi:hypothetical protein
MAKELNIVLGQSGLSVTANVYLLGVAAATGIACPEIGTTGEYSGNFSATPNTAGIYQVVFFTDGGVLACGGGQIVWDGTAEVTSGTSRPPSRTLMPYWIVRPGLKQTGRYDRGSDLCWRRSPARHPGSIP